MSKRWIQITDLQKQEIEEKLERRNPLLLEKSSEKIKTIKERNKEVSKRR